MSAFSFDISPLRRDYRRCAFTLTELLAAVGILLVLVLLVIPLGGKMVNLSRTTGCAQSMRQTGVALMLYRGDHDGWFPPGHALSYSSDLGDRYEAAFKRELVPQYLPEMTYCPAMRLQNTPEAKRRYPDEKKRLKQLGSYAINAFLLNKKPESLPGADWDGSWGDRRHPYPGDHRMVFLVETTSAGSANAWFHSKTALNGYNVSSRMIAPRDHGALRLNFMFLDGHIKAIAPKPLDDSEYDWSADFDKYGSDQRNVQPRNLPHAPSS